jgi:hypothetical protein
MRGAGDRSIPPENIPRAAIAFVVSLVATGIVWLLRGREAAEMTLFMGVFLVIFAATHRRRNQVG